MGRIVQALFGLMFFSLVLFSCVFNNKKAIFSRIKDKYGCSVKYVVDNFNESEKRNLKYYKLILSSSSELNALNDHNVASNVALMFYPYLEDKRDKYASLIIIVPQLIDGLQLASEIEFDMEDVAAAYSKIESIQLLKASVIDNDHAENELFAEGVSELMRSKFGKSSENLTDIRIEGFNISAGDQLTIKTVLEGEATTIDMDVLFSRKLDDKQIHGLFIP